MGGTPTLTVERASAPRELQQVRDEIGHALGLLLDHLESAAACIIQVERPPQQRPSAEETAI